MPIEGAMTNDDKARVAERWSDISSGSDEFSANVLLACCPSRHGASPASRLRRRELWVVGRVLPWVIRPARSRASHA